ncbi:sulfotransferase family protein [Sphingomonas hankyongi]|uniref:Sulfotransferase n=1 Tax=Sphingomonas hankyongi TaxID=2908209 RepID=A0ABT0S0R7_9SPHN|nr:sulfotransferase [Sphingomonas hankyongi]MCL6729450.1 sulfotransferase [Sphingomonas hankyongi]
MPHIGDFERFAFIVGAPRSGTTTMSKMLRTHPNVAVPFVKEPHFFTQHDLRGLAEPELRTRVESEYLDKFFDDPEPGRSVAMDGSVSYLYVPEQLEPALRLWPGSRFIVGVRDPLTLLPSLHRRLIYVGDENIMSFEEAWAAIPDRAAGRRIPRLCLDPRFLRYDEAGRYATYVERLFATVGRDRCFVSVFDDLTRDPRGQYERIMDFLGLQPQAEVDLSGEREGRTIRYPWLQQLLKRPPKALHPYLAGKLYRRRMKEPGSSGGKADPSPGKLMSVRKRLLQWNRVDSAEKQPISLAVQEQIRDHFKDEIDRLGTLIDRDLSHWLQPREQVAQQD